MVWVARPVVVDPKGQSVTVGGQDETVPVVVTVKVEVTGPSSVVVVRVVTVPVLVVGTTVVTVVRPESSVVTTVVVTAVVTVVVSITVTVAMGSSMAMYTVRRMVMGTFWRAWRARARVKGLSPPQNWAGLPGQATSHWSRATLLVAPSSMTAPQ